MFKVHFVLDYPRNGSLLPWELHLLKPPRVEIWVHSLLKVAAVSAVQPASHTSGLEIPDHGPEAAEDTPPHLVMPHIPAGDRPEIIHKLS